MGLSFHGRRYNASPPLGFLARGVLPALDHLLEHGQASRSAWPGGADSQLLPSVSSCGQERGCRSLYRDSGCTQRASPRPQAQANKRAYLTGGANPIIRSAGRRAATICAGWIRRTWLRPIGTVRRSSSRRQEAFAFFPDHGITLATEAFQL